MITALGASVATAAVAADSRFLPRPEAGITVPIVVILVGLALFWITRKLLGLAFLAAVIAVLFLAYQGGAFDHFVDKGKQLVRDQRAGA